jgi:hypothetical protein
VYCIRIEAHSEKSGVMELAFLDSGVRPPGTESNKVLYFDLGREEQNLSPNVTVSRHGAMFELLQFPLLYEKGIGGYYLPDKVDGQRGGGVVSTTGVSLSLQDYSRAMLYQNPRMHYMGRLAQEWALVMHSRHVENILNFQKNKELQARLQRRRRDAEMRRGVNGGEEGAGSRQGMTASVVGSKKYNQALVEDSCAVSAELGQGSLFITMTTNPHWPEIQNALEPGQTWEDRPDIVNRVFKLKLQELLEDLRKGNLFKDRDGKPWESKYIMHVVEFQKRGALCIMATSVHTHTSPH